MGSLGNEEFILVDIEFHPNDSGLLKLGRLDHWSLLKIEKTETWLL